MAARKKKVSGHYAMKVAYEHGWKKPRPTGRQGLHQHPWEHSEHGTLIGSGLFNANAPWIHREPKGRKVGEYPRLIDAVRALATPEAT